MAILCRLITIQDILVVYALNMTRKFSIELSIFIGAHAETVTRSLE
jgi:hypothetical protein